MKRILLRVISLLLFLTGTIMLQGCGAKASSTAAPGIQAGITDLT